MIHIGLLDYLLIRPLDASVTFQYWIFSEDGTEILTDTVSGENYSLLLISSTTFANYINKSLLLKIVTSTPNTYWDVFTISAISNHLALLQKIVGLVGKNKKTVVEDTQDGHIIEQTEELYTDNTYETKQFSFNRQKSFVTNYIPDYRFFIQSEFQIEEE